MSDFYQPVVLKFGTGKLIVEKSLQLNKFQQKKFSYLIIKINSDALKNFLKIIFQKFMKWYKAAMFRWFVNW